MRVNKYLLSFAVFVVISLQAWSSGVAEIDLRDLDLSNAKASVSGAGEIYLTSIEYLGQAFSAKLEYSVTRGFEVVDIAPKRISDLRDYIDLNFTKFAVRGQDTIEVSNIVIGEKAYSGLLRYTPEGAFALDIDGLWEVSLPDAYGFKIGDAALEIANEKLKSDNTQLNERVKELQNANKELQDAVSSLKAKQATLVYQIDTLRGALEEREKELETLRLASAERAAALDSESARLRAELAALDSRIEELSANNAGLAGEIDALKRENARLAAGEKTLASDTENLRAEVASLESEGRTLSSQVAALTDENVKLSGEKATLTLRVTELEAGEIASDRRIETLTAQNAELSLKHKELGQENTALESRIGELAGQNTVLAGERDDLKAKLQASQGELRNQIDQLEGARSALQRQVEMLERESEALTGERNALDSENARLKADLESAVAENQTLIREHTAERDRLDRKSTDLSDRVARLSEQNLRLSHTLDGYQAELAEVSEQRRLDSRTVPLPESLDLRYGSLAVGEDGTVAISNVVVMGQAYSGVLRFRGDGTLEIEEYRRVPFPQATEFPAELDLSYATLVLAEDDSIQVFDVVVGGQGYSGVLKPRRDGSFEVERYWKTAYPEYTKRELSDRVADLEAAVAENQTLIREHTAERDRLTRQSKDMADRVAVLSEQNSILSHTLDEEQAELAEIAEQRRLDNRTVPLPESLDLRYGSLAVGADDSILVSDVVVGDQSYSGIMRPRYDGSLEIERYWKTPYPEYTRQELFDRLAGLETENLDLKEDLQADSLKFRSLLDEGFLDPTDTVMTGFGSGASLFGNWEHEGDLLTQKDTTYYFAKYGVPFERDYSEVVFEFSTRALRDTWLGCGIHVLAGSERTARGYGFGKSFLIWVTSDLKYYKTADTFLQIYQSSDDINMIQLKSVRIPESIYDSVKIRIYYSRTENKFIVSVNGRKRLDYLLETPVPLGNKIVFRTLGGPVEFQDFTVRVRH